MILRLSFKIFHSKEVNLNNIILRFVSAVILLAAVSGCAQHEGNTGQMATFIVPSTEAKWIRDGQPIEFEGENWHPQDEIDVLLDSEVEKMGEYNGVEFFIEKMDVRPFNRLYTKFARNKFRVFEKNSGDD